MVNPQIDSLWNALESMWQLALAALRLDPLAYVTVLASAEAALLALGILLLAAASYTIGQSVVLFADRVPRKRFISSVAMSVLILVLGLFFWAASTWLIAALLFDSSRDYLDVLVVVSLSYAPYLFGFLVLLPYLGNLVAAVLRIWVFLGLLTAVMVIYQFKFWEALLCSAIGWVLLELVQYSGLFPIDRWRNWLWQVGTGTPRQLGTDEAVDLYIAEHQRRSEPDSDE